MLFFNLREKGCHSASCGFAQGQLRRRIYRIKFPNVSVGNPLLPLPFLLGFPTKTLGNDGEKGKTVLLFIETSSFQASPKSIIPAHLII
jgi:hypothetical protein